MPYSPLSAAARSPARPWSHTAHTAARPGSSPWPMRARIIPPSTSPEPPLAMPELPVGLTKHRPSGQAVMVRWPLSTSTQRCSAANLRAAPSRSPPDRSPPSRANSPSWGVSTVAPAGRASRISICSARAFMPSASTTNGPFSSSSRDRASRSVCRSRPRPGPMRTASHPWAKAMFSRYSPRMGRAMASSHLAARMGHTCSGVRMLTSPAPVRRAPRAASTGAPVKPTLPPRMRVLPKVPLWPSAGRRGSQEAASPASARQVG